MRITIVAALVGSLAVLACNDSLSTDTDGAVRVAATISGVDLDADGITVSVDGGAPVVVLPPESETFRLTMGHHVMTVGGIADNCTLNGSETRSIGINAGDTSEVSLLETCQSLTGVIEVTAPTAGPDADADGYTVTLDAGPATAIAANGVIRFPELSGGAHQLAFAGLAPNCTAASASPVEVSVSVGLPVRDTARVVIGVNCTAVTGVIEVRTGTKGPDGDSDGYQASLDAGPAQLLLPNGIYRFEGVSGGTHSVNVTGLAPNCTEPGPNPHQVGIAVGGATRDTQVVVVAVACTATTGVIQIRTVTTGPDQDADGYGASIDGGPVRSLQANAVANMEGVPGGSHSLAFSGFASNCTPGGSNPLTVSVGVGGTVPDTVHVTLNVVCTANTGAVRVHDVTTGPWQPAQYLVSRDGGPAAAMPKGTDLLLAPLVAGNHSILLTGVPPTCTVTSPNPVTVSVAISDTADVAFDVSCTSPPATGAQLVFTTSGGNLDPSYHLEVFSDCYYCYTQYFDGMVGPNGTVGLTLPPGSYIYQISDVAPNCIGPSYGTFMVIDQQLATVALNYACAPTGTLRVSIAESGPDQDQSFYLAIDGATAAYMGYQDILSLPLRVGSHTIQLSGVAANCSVASSNPTTVTIGHDSTTDLVFAITCVAHPQLQVTVTTTGANAPASYQIGVDPDYYYGYTYSTSVAATGIASLGLPPGNHFVTLDQVPLNCTVTSANNVQVTMALGVQTNLAFAVTCH